jgi:hypothetical protein
MKAARIVSLFASAALTIWLTACGGGGSTPPPPQAISVAVSAVSSSLVVGATTSITASVTNDSANAGVKWTVSCSSCGSVSPTSTASGAATTYTAPSAVPSPATVTVTATSVTDTTKTASATITISAAPPISVALNPTPPMSLAAGSTTSLTAVVSNDSANAGVKWTVTCSATACGSFAPTSTASGTATTYTAPSTGGISVTVTATSVTDTTKTASATISITATAPVIAVTFNPAAPASVVAGTTTSLTAVVANDSANAGVTWSVTCGSAQCGSIAPTSTASGTAATYTAPAVPPSPATVTITATSVTDTTKTATATVSIALGVPGNGTYVYSISGTNTTVVNGNSVTGPYFVAGAFTVSNGAITGGEQDYSDAASAYTNNLSASGSSLSVVGSNVQIVLNTGNTAIGVSGIETFRGAPVSTSRMLISEFDTFGTGTGSVDLQTSTAAPSGGYAFNLLGLDSSLDSLAIGGILDITGTSISNTGSVFDFNDGGTVGQSNFFSSGSVTAPDSFGRVVFTLTPSSTSIAQFILNGYIVGTNRIQLVEALDPRNADLGGVALGQGSNTGNFTAAGIAGVTYVFTAPGQDGNGDMHIGGGFVFNSNLSLSGVLALNDLVNFGSLTITAGNYTVDPTGRVTITGVSPSLVSGTPFAFQLYLDGNGNALTLGVDNTELNAGMAYQQTAPSAPFAGTYALSGNGVGVLSSGFPSWSAAGPATVASNTFTGYTDYTLMGATAPTSNVTLSGTETSASGTLSLTGLNAAAPSAGSGPISNVYTYFPIDTTRVIALETDGVQLGLLQLEGVTP